MERPRTTSTASSSDQRRIVRLDPSITALRHPIQCLPVALTVRMRVNTNTVLRMSFGTCTAYSKFPRHGQHRQNVVCGRPENVKP